MDTINSQEGELTLLDHATQEIHKLSRARNMLNLQAIS